VPAMINLSNFSQPDPAREESMPVGPVPIRNYPLVCQLVKEAFSKDPERTVLLLTSNGSMDKPATEWKLRRVVA